MKHSILKGIRTHVYKKRGHPGYSMYIKGFKVQVKAWTGQITNMQK